MSFFEPPPPPKLPDEDEVQPPEWAGPPRNVLGAAVPVRLLLARTRKVVVAVTDATAYPSGFEFSLTIRSRPSADDDDFDPLEFDEPFMWRYRRRGRAEIPPEFLRFGIEFADGSRATNLGHGFALDLDERPEGPVLLQHGGGGGGGNWEQGYWVWPLPPPGRLAFVCEWPAREIPLTRKEIDAELVRRAADEAEILWETPRGRAGTWSAHSSTVTAVATSRPAAEKLPDKPPEADERD